MVSTLSSFCCSKIVSVSGYKTPDVYIICGSLYFPFVGMCHHYQSVSCNMKLNPSVFLYSVSGFVSNQLSLYLYIIYCIIYYKTKSGLVIF